MRQKLSPVALRTMGAFAKYAHEEETGAFTMKDKKDLMKRTAKHNWKIAKFLFRKRKGAEVEQMYNDGKKCAPLDICYNSLNLNSLTHTQHDISPNAKIQLKTRQPGSVFKLPI